MQACTDTHTHTHVHTALHPHVCGLWLCHRAVARHRPKVSRSRAFASAAGATWWLVIANAPWAGRHGHSTVIDAAGAIYVLGGRDGGGNLYNDMWVADNGGADRTRAGVLEGC